MKKAVFVWTLFNPAEKLRILDVCEGLGLDANLVDDGKRFMFDNLSDNDVEAFLELANIEC